MSWSTALADLRTQLSDGATDKLRYRKPLIGKVDGNNTLFKTLEFRRLTDFTGPDDRFGVYLNGQQAASGAVSVDFQDTGEFELGKPRSTALVSRPHTTFSGSPMLK